MPHTAQTTKEIFKLAEEQGVIQVRDVHERDIHPEYLRRLYAKGRLIKPARGQYALPNTRIGEYHSLVAMAKAVPGAVICLVSALRFHDMGTQMPHIVWANRSGAIGSY